MNLRNSYYLTMTCIFIAVSLFVYLLQSQIPAYNFLVLESCAALVFGLSVTSFLLVSAQMHKSPMAFTRGVTGATLLKMMVCMIAMLVYILLNRDTLHKPSVFVFFGIYAVFTAAETFLLSKIVKAVK